jgi:hypothetical protein
MCRLAAIFLVLLTTAASAQSLPFFARPAVTNEGDAVNFSYREDLATVKYHQIASWRWDFNGDVTNPNNPNDAGWDEQYTVGDQDPDTGLPIAAQDIGTTWYATYNSASAVNNVQTVTPRLQITRKAEHGGGTFNQVGCTENVLGPTGIDPNVQVKKRSAGNADLRIQFSATPRLLPSTESLRFYSTVTPADNRTLSNLTYNWVISNQSGGSSPAPQTSANPQLPSLADGSYDVTLTVGYSVTYLNAQGVSVTETGESIQETKPDFIRVVSSPQSLVRGRAYRRGFPDVFGWEDIMSAYQAVGANNNRYVYFNHFEDAFFTQQGLMQTPAEIADPAKRKTMAEIVNETLQGQLLIANQRLVEALRIKYPRLAADVNPDEDRLNPPAGARSETAAIDQALLDYQLPLYYTTTAMVLYGSDILRGKAAVGAEPYPQFPQYLTIDEPTLSQAPIPIKNEYWQLTTLLERMCLGRMEKAKKLYRLSAQDSTALAEAKEEAKNTGLHSYLGMALLASGQSERDYQTNEGNSLLAHQKNARDLFERINAGLNPLGNDGSFIPNESFAATYQDATEAVADAREAEINARQESRLWESYQAELRNEHLSQRTNYITPLKNLTSIDPALYNDLKTADDQRDYRAVVQGRVEALLEDYPDADPRVVGELGSYVINVLDAAQGVEQAKNDAVNLFKRIDIAKWANTEINATISNTTEQLQAIDAFMGIYEGLLHTQAGFTFSPFAAVAGVQKGILNGEKTALQALQTMTINDINLEREIKGMLLELGNLGIAVERAGNTLKQAQLALDNQLARMDRLIEDLAYTRDGAANLYFQDPSFKVVLSTAMRRAESEMDYAIDRLYRLAKTLQYEWTEAYQNPLIIPVNSQEPASLENPLFDNFTQTDSLFFIRTADEAKDYLDALKAWDSKLRRINVVSVRGPNHSGPISAEPISMRETILNLRPDATRGYTLDHSIRDFRNYLETRRKANFYNVANPSLEIPFATTIEDNRFFPATGSRWNMRVTSVAADIYAESGFSTKQVAEIDLIQSGIVSLRRYWAAPPLADDVTKLTFNVDNINRTAFAVAFPARINGATGGRPLTEFDNLGLSNRPIAATNWILRINTDGTTNQQIDFSKIKDIVIRFTYTFGNPPEFPSF